MIEIDTELCKGCGVCIAFCPKHVLEASDRMNKRGSYPPVAARPDDCIRCLNCELLCPDLAIVIVDGEGE